MPGSIRSRIGRQPDDSACSRSAARRPCWSIGNRRRRRTGSATFVPVGFEADRLRERPVQSGLDPFRPVFVSWLGVTGYLSRAAIATALRDPGGLAPRRGPRAFRARAHSGPAPKTFSRAASALRSRPGGRATPRG
ncbi:class I SAM-dependent methyltransferase [Amycolatopsis sp. MtRt-6]|uniref:class I SAM-dependent methyltransferase n=1 Tax=Amycolatopsis sp. MtRt-6 TaxID=2792782 RepID=UPI001A8DC163